MIDSHNVLERIYKDTLIPVTDLKSHLIQNLKLTLKLK